MRRKDREVTDAAMIESIMKEAQICRLGLLDSEGVYIVPLNYGYERNDSGYVLYFHGAQEGRKMDILRRGDKVSFEIDTGYELITSGTACGYTAKFKSIMGSGRVRIAESNDEKSHMLDIVMTQCTEKKEWSYSEAMLREVCCFSITVESLSCKEHL